MPRGRKSYTLEEQLERITNEISNMETSLAEMKKAKKKLEDQIKMNRLSELDDLLTEKGITIEKIMELIENGQDA